MLARRRCMAWATAAVLAVAPIPAFAADLLRGATVVVTTNLVAGGADWAPPTMFDKAQRYDLRLRVTFNVASRPAGPMLTLTKPNHINDWTLNGAPVMGPPKDMFFPVLDGIPTSALVVGTNVLEAKFGVNAFARDGRLSPASTGDLKLELQPADLSRFGIRTGPVLGAAGYDYFTVGCRTRMPATVTLHCDGRTWTSTTGVVHRLRADGLKEGQAYAYRLVADLAGGGAVATSKVWQVSTLSRKVPLAFVALGDARGNPKIWGRIAAKAMTFHPAFAIHTGDIVGNGTDYESWDKEFAKPAEAFLASVPCFYTFGNHENNVSMLYSLFGFTEGDNGNYSQVIGPVQLFAMNRFEDWNKGSTNLVRLERDLAASRASFIFTFTHTPAWSSGTYGVDKLGSQVHFPIFERYGVTAALAGHDHCYERSEPGRTTMLITGGGGASLYGPKNAEHNPHSKIFRSEYNFLVFEATETNCTMRAMAFGDAQTRDNERKLEEIDRRVWEARKMQTALPVPQQ